MRKDTPIPALVLLTILFGWIVILTRCNGAEVRLAWDAAPAAENVASWKVYRMEGANRTLLTTVTTPAATVTAEPGQVIGVTAFNGFESQPVTLTLPSAPGAPTGLRVVEIQTSANLKDWKPLAYVPLEDGDPAKFIRAAITSIPKP
jgi:hypothetical protein